MAESGNHGARGAAEDVLDTWLESTLDSVDQAEERVVQIAGSAGLEEEDLHKVGMAVREAMVNAVVHGNRYSALKRVHLRVTQSSEALTIRIADQGEGFDASKLPDPLAEENLLRQSGRGLLLIRAFVDEFDIRPAEPRGTEFILVKYRAAGPGGN